MAQQSRNIPDGLLIKYLLGETDAEERVQVESWMAADETNVQKFRDFERIWNESGQLAMHMEANEDAAWQRFQIRRAQTAVQPVTVRKFSVLSYGLRAAAVLLMMIGSGYLLYLNYLRPDNDYIVWEAGDRVRADTLPDGSVVTMNKGAVLSFTGFKREERRVKLDGEAFFEVKKDPARPFIVEAHKAHIRVLGTAFNILSTEDSTVVIVDNGTVSVAKTDQAVVLKANEKATVTGNLNAPLKGKNNDQLYQYYKRKEFILNATPLWRFADVLSQAYNVTIVIADDRLKELKMTATFKNEALQNILLVVGETLNLTIEQKGDTIILR